MPAVKRRTFRLEEDELYCEERGEGEPLLLLHGHGGTHDDWRHVFDLDALAERYRVITPDARKASSVRRCGRRRRVVTASSSAPSRTSSCGARFLSSMPDDRATARGMAENLLD
jgi:pimeloyl-ACP methyl ester carboxylesterase